jgi:hypothetical protein
LAAPLIGEISKLCLVSLFPGGLPLLLAAVVVFEIVEVLVLLLSCLIVNDLLILFIMFLCVF